MNYKEKSESLNKRFPRIISSEHAKEVFNKAKQEAKQTGFSTFVVHTLSQSQNEVTSYNAEVLVATKGGMKLKVNGNSCTIANLMAVMVGAWLELNAK